MVAQTKKQKASCGRWGHVVDDVSAVVDIPGMWTDLREKVTVGTVWPMKVTAEKLALMPLRVTDLSLPKMTLEGALRDTPEAAAEAKGDAHFVVSSGLAMQAIENRGRGWIARRHIPAGTLVLMEKPLVSILDIEWSKEPWADCGAADTTALGNVLAKVAEEIGSITQMMHPSAAVDVDEEEDEEDQELLDAAVERAWAGSSLPVEEQQRLRSVVHLNSLGFYTNSEQLYYSRNWQGLTGAGIFGLASGFNHSCDPSVARFSIGEITGFVTNRDVSAGEELCISYIETELLCTPTSFRAETLNRDFTCACTKCVAEPSQSSAPCEYLSVDSQVQAYLSLMPAARRLEAIQSLLGEEQENSITELVMVGKDAQELRVTAAMAQMSLKMYPAAVQTWRRLVAFSCHYCPPFDESLAVYCTQLALCAFECSDLEAEKYASAAVAAHRMAFGPQAMEGRYAEEVRQSEVSDKAKKAFWCAVNSVSPLNSCPTPAEFVEGFRLQPDEIPAVQNSPAEDWEDYFE